VSDFVLPSRHASGVLWIAETDLGPNKPDIFVSAASARSKLAFDAPQNHQLGG
jgi:hypothetical protein